MLLACLRCFPCSSAQDQINLVIYAELLVDAHIVKLQHMVEAGPMLRDAQLVGIQLLDDLLTLCIEFESRYTGSKPILSLSRRLLSDHKKLGLHFVPELFPSVRSLFIILGHLELEDEKLFILEFLAFILKWDVQDDKAASKAAFNLCEVHLFFFPVISLMSSPSKSVKQAASRFILLLEKLLGSNLVPLEYHISVQREVVHVSKPETIVFRLLQHLWLQDLPCGSFYLNVFSSSRHNIALEKGSLSWIYQLKEYASWTSGRQKSSVSISSTAELISPEMPLLLGAVVASLVMHHSLEFPALDLLASLGEMEPKLGFTLLLGVLYYSNFLSATLKCSTDMLLKLLRVLPSLASHSAMQPLIVQTILPMLQKDSNRILYATALRLLCKAWEMNDKVFGTLQVFLLPECFREFGSDRTVGISMAACLRDICRRNPDKGIELILSIAGCIECHDAVIQALGLQSLGFLCEADAIDFYTAWDVIANHVKEYLAEPVVAYSLCTLLRWGSTDADAYTEASESVLQVLWNFGSHIFPSLNPLWKKARITAFVAINHFEVSQIQNSLPDLMVKCMELLVSETDVDILKVIGELKTKIIAYEHSTRRRMISEKKAPRSKIEKLLDVFPRVVFSSGRCNTQDMPGAALFCLPFTSKDFTQGNFQNADDVFDEYHNIVKEVSGSLHLSRNTLLAVLSLQSWKSLMKRWLKDYNCVLVKASSTVFDRTSKAANDILKDMINLAGDSIPRMAENISLAIGAYCLILPSSAHDVKTTASKFLLGWLSQHEHEHRQWSAAIAIGAISSCLHATDRQQKLQCISGLLEVSCQSRSSFVKGACSVGLGFACQDLLTRPVSDENTPNKDNYALQEKSHLGKIVRDLSSAISQASQMSPDPLESLHEYKASDMDYDYVDSSRLVFNNCDDMDGDIWGVAGLVLGLGLSTSALFRAGSYDAIRSIKLLCTSLVANVSSLVSDFNFGGPSILLSIGACLVLPTITSFCRRVDMMHDDELNDTLSSYENLISTLLTVKTSNTLHQNLLMASCVGGGALLASILGEGLFPLDAERVQNLLELFKAAYSTSYPDLVHLGAFLGVVNTMGADAGCLFNQRSSIVPQTHYNKKESSDIDVPLLSRLSFVENLGLMQDMFLVAQQPGANHLQAYAAWAISFLREHLLSKEFHGIHGKVDDTSASSRPFDQSFSKDATVVKLSLWLMQLDYTKCQVHVNTVAAALRCLADAPRLPEFDWGAVIRRCIKYESHVAGLSHGSSGDNKSLLEECLQFSVAHASKFDSLLNLLDDLTCLSRFRTLDIVMQSCLVFHLSDLMRIFSSSRNQMLLEDMHEFLSSPIYSDQQNTRQKWFLQLAFWKALAKCVNKPSEDISEYLCGMEKCVEVLFKLLPASSRATSTRKEQMPCLLWHESVACLSNIRQSCLMSLLQFSAVDEVQRHKPLGADLKKMLSLAKLVKIGSMPLTELGKLKSYIMCTKSEDMWDVLVEVAAVLQNTESARRQWLIDILEISCITKYPSTALQLIGLLSGSSCKYMPFLIADPKVVLLDLPVTLSCLLLTPKWHSVAETAVSYLWTSTERIYAWATCVSSNDDQRGLHPIEGSEKGSCDLLVNVMVDACYKLKEYLPLQNQLQLVNMVQTRRVNT